MLRGERGNLGANLEFAFETDMASTPVAREHESLIKAALSSPEFDGARLTSVECKATRCRLQITFTNLDKDRILLPELLGSSKYKVNQFAALVPSHEERADGTVLATVYLFPSETTPADEDEAG